MTSQLGPRMRGSLGYQATTGVEVQPTTAWVKWPVSIATSNRNIIAQSQVVRAVVRMGWNPMTWSGLRCPGRTQSTNRLWTSGTILHGKPNIINHNPYYNVFHAIILYQKFNDCMEKTCIPLCVCVLAPSAPCLSHIQHTHWLFFGLWDLGTCTFFAHAACHVNLEYCPK